MPKKRHWAMYSKPQSTAPHSLESSGLQSNLHHEEPQSRNVNDLLANLRRVTLSSSGSGSSSLAAGSSRLPTLSPIPVVTPSVPPEVAHILLPSPPNGGGPIGLGVGQAAAAHGHHAHGGGAGIHGGASIGAGGANGLGAAGGGGRRRGPAGPAPPPSWLAQSRHAPRRILRAAGGGGDGQRGGKRRHPAVLYGHHAGEDMPGIVRPARGSLVDVVLRRMVLEWETQKQYNQYYLIYLQGPLRAALVSYLGQLSEDEDGKGATIKDLRALLLHPLPPPPTGGSSPHTASDGEVESDEREEGDEEPLPSPSTLNEDFRYLDLTWSVGQSISIRELSDLLFPGRAARARSRFSAGGTSQNQNRAHHGQNDAELLESWDAPGILSPSRPLLPNLTHLSLALTPDRSPQAVSWRQLLSFAAHLPMLTHLSLAYWPEPTLTPNAKFATVVSPLGQRFQYGGTGAYSHSLDNDWAEVVLLMRKLSKALYGLEYLDLTGCASWLPGLMHKVDNGQVDWVGDWGKMTTLVVNYGVSNEYDRLSEEILEANRPADMTDQIATLGLRPGQRPVSPQPLGEVARRVNASSEARLIERHIRQQRAGRGRFITVIYDRQPEATR